jgi:ankyrin repeat protein
MKHSRRIRLLLRVYLALPLSLAAAEPCDFTAAVKQDDVSAIKALLDSGCDPNVIDARRGPPLYQAAMDGRLKATQLLLERGADPSAWGLPFRLTSDTRIGTLKMLLNHGLSVKSRTRTATHCCTRRLGPSTRSSPTATALDVGAATPGWFGSCFHEVRIPT